MRNGCVLNTASLDLPELRSLLPVTWPLFVNEACGGNFWFAVSAVRQSSTAARTPASKPNSGSTSTTKANQDHALIQEIAYDRLEPDDRKALHAAAGTAYELVYADRPDEVLDRLFPTDPERFAALQITDAGRPHRGATRLTGAASQSRATAVSSRVV